MYEKRSYSGCFLFRGYLYQKMPFLLLTSQANPSGRRRCSGALHNNAIALLCNASEVVYQDGTGLCFELCNYSKRKTNTRISKISMSLRAQRSNPRVKGFSSGLPRSLRSLAKTKKREDLICGDYNYVNDYVDLQGRRSTMILRTMVVRVRRERRV